MKRLTELLEDAVGATTPTFAFDDVVARAESVHRRRRASAAVAVVAIVFAGIVGLALSLGHKSSGPAVNVSPTTIEKQFRATTLHDAAVDWAHAFLTGTAEDIKAMEGPECGDSTTSTTFDPQFVANYLEAMRANLAQHLGRPLDEIKIVNVLTRNVTGTTGEAEVVYDLPNNVVGNDNWVSYARHDGRWLVSDCTAPIGGESSSAGGSG